MTDTSLTGLRGTGGFAPTGLERTGDRGPVDLTGGPDATEPLVHARGVDNGDLRSPRLEIGGDPFERSEIEVVGELVPLRDEREVAPKPSIGQFLKVGSATVKLGHLTGDVNVRADDQKSLFSRPKERGAGAVVVYDASLRETFSIGLGAKRDHVWGAVISDTNRNILPRDQWTFGWIATHKLEEEPGKAGLVRGKTGDAIEADLGDVGLGGPDAPTRTMRAPASIRAWAEQHGKDLTQTMPLTLGGEPLADGVVLDAVPVPGLDPGGELALRPLDPDSDVFQEFVGYLQRNAQEMPGTMAKDHELRDTKTGGERAREGQAWLASYGMPELRDAEFIAIDGATVTNIYVNDSCPTWAAYDENVQALSGQVDGTLGFMPSHSMDDGDFAAFRTDRPGECLVFHGTGAGNVKNIARGGFDPEYCNYAFGKGYGKTGYGTAFTDQFAKALAYAPPSNVGDADAPTYKHFVVVAKVFSGNVHDAEDRARRTRGNLELAEHNINSDVSVGCKPRAQGRGDNNPLTRLQLGQTGGSHLQGALRENAMRNSTLQHRTFDLQMTGPGGDGGTLSYRDSSLTIPDAIQMYPAFIIECEIPREAVHTASRGTHPKD